MKSAAMSRSGGFLFALFFSVFVGVWLNQSLTTRPLFAVALHNLAYAHSLAVDGSFSSGITKGESRPPVVGRDLLLPLALSGWMIATVSDLEKKDTDQINKDSDLVKIKQFNVILLALSVLGLYFTALALTHSVFSAILSSFGYGILIIAEANRNYTDSATAEPIAILLTVLFSFFIIITAKKKSYIAAALAALSLCGLVFSKAIFLYFTIPIGILVGLLNFYRLRGAKFSILAGLLISFLPIIFAVPWMWRNSNISGEFKLASGGGAVLYYRALLDTATWEEYRGSFYTLSPAEARPFVGRILGYSTKDLEMGGPLQRLAFFNKDIAAHDKKAIAEASPEKTITFRHRMTAEAALRSQTAHADGISADRQLQSVGLRMILENPLGHLALIGPILWHGMWVDAVPFYFGPFLFWSILGAAIVAVFRRDWTMLAVCTLPALSAGAYGMMSHFIPRYSVPMLPVMVLTSVYIISFFVGMLLTHIKQRYGQHSEAAA